MNPQLQYYDLPAEREHYLDSNVIAAIFQYSAQPAALFYVDIIPSFRHNKKTCQWDVRANEVTMEYGEHLGPVNTATLIDDDRFLFEVMQVVCIDSNFHFRRLATTSDDKKMCAAAAISHLPFSSCDRYIWEFGIPVVMKHISEPFMHRFASVVSFIFL